MRKGITVFPITERGHELSQKALGKFDGLLIHSPGELKGGGLSEKVKKAFKGSGALFFICASGIAVRSIAPFIKNKAADPAVVLMDEAGRFCVSLLSGHLGGGNALTKRLSEIYNATPVITTATDAMGLPCAEDIAEKFSLRIENIRDIKIINSAILKGGAVQIIDRDPKRLKALKNEFGGSGVFGFKKAFPKSINAAGTFIFVSSSAEKLDGKAVKRTLIMRPKEYVLGIGCRRGVSVREIGEAVGSALEAEGISPLSIRNLASIDIKNNEKGLLSYARKNGLEIEFFKAEELNRVKSPSRSSFVEDKTEAWGVSEPSALLSAKVKRLCVKKRKSCWVTVAAARVPFTSSE